MIAKRAAVIESALMKDSLQLWRDVHDLFEADDGSLPQIRVTFTSKTAAALGYELLRKRAERVASSGAYFWSTTRAEEVPLEAVPNPAALVVSGEAEPFHVVLGGIQSEGIAIPDLGVFVFPDQLVLDYKMGAEWGEREVAALLELITELVGYDKRASVSFQDQVVREVNARFDRAWRRWRDA